MKRPVVAFSIARNRSLRHYQPVDSFGYTLVEILVATVLSLILMGAVVRMFGDVGESITDSRAMLESADRLRVVEARLQMDLAGVTATLNPPRKPENNEGYFEYIEGPVTQATAPTYDRNTDVIINATLPEDNPNRYAPLDTTVGDFDDILMFTTRSKSRPFVGKVPTTVNATGTIQSDVAEVAWFLRGNTLHRRVLLVTPSASIGATTAGYYANYDVSASMQNGVLKANTLGDLTRRECRYAHNTSAPYAIPWHWSYSGFTFPTLPTLAECTATGWLPSTTSYTLSVLDFWTNDTTKRLTDQAYATATSRYADDVILTNVIGFDVKGWDPVAGAYVDLGYAADTEYAAGTPVALGLGHVGHPNSGLSATTTMNKPKIRLAACVYDTYSTSYESVDASDGFDNDTNVKAPGYGIIDDDGEKGVAPPYPIPLRGIQVKIRTFEPDSKQVREVTVVQDFLPQ